MKACFFLLLLLGNLFTLFAQRSDFYDSYDYDLRKQKIDSETPEYFKNYNLPAKRPKPGLLTPKSVQRQMDITSMIPQGSPVRTQAAPTTLNPNSSPVNLFTGELNAEAILKDQENKRKAKEAKKKAIENFERPVYSETSFRRGEIVFFMTFPFALAASGLVAALIESSDKGFIKTPSGAMLIGFGSIGLSLGNVWLDAQRNREFQEEKKRNPLLERPLEYRSGLNLQFYIPFVEVRF